MRSDIVGSVSSRDLWLGVGLPLCFAVLIGTVWIVGASLAHWIITGDPDLVGGSLGFFGGLVVLTILWVHDSLRPGDTW